MPATRSTPGARHQASHGQTSHDRGTGRPAGRGASAVCDGRTAGPDRSDPTHRPSRRPPADALPPAPRDPRQPPRSTPDQLVRGGRRALPARRARPRRRRDRPARGPAARWRTNPALKLGSLSHHGRRTGHNALIVATATKADNPKRIQDTAPAAPRRPRRTPHDESHTLTLDLTAATHTSTRTSKPCSVSDPADGSTLDGHVADRCRRRSPRPHVGESGDDAQSAGADAITCSPAGRCCRGSFGHRR